MNKLLPLVVLAALLFGAAASARAQETDSDAQTSDSVASGSSAPSGARRGVWQGGSVDLDFLPQHDGLGYRSIDASGKLGLPSPIKGHFILFSPSAAYYDVEVPDSRRIANEDLELYSTGASFSYVVPRSQDLMYNATVGLKWNGDGKAHDSESLNVFGLGLAIWNASDEWKWLFGAAYSESGDIHVVPFVGAIWKPREDLTFDLSFPAPKIAKRLDFLPYSDESSYWAYVGGSIGSFTGVFEPLGTPDADAAKVEYRGFRALVGVEKQTTEALGGAAELGVSFGQKYEIESLNGPYWREKRSPDPNLFLRTKLSF